MTMDLQHPLIIKFNADNQPVSLNNDILSISITNRKSWYAFKSAVDINLQNNKFDSAVMSFNDIGKDELANPDILKSANIHANQVLRSAWKNNTPVFNRYQKQLYFLNPSFKQIKQEGKQYVVDDQTVLSKRNKFPDDLDWQKHQADINKKFAVLMPLTTGQKYESSNHLADLMQPKRGLSKDQVKDFFSWKSNMSIIPELMSDNMVGMPAMKATVFSDIKLSYHNELINSSPLNIKTAGAEGYVIPMRNTHGDAAKSQIGSDVTPYNLTLKAKANDGMSIQTSEYFDKKSREYTFKFADDSATHLHPVEADNSHIILEDVHGQFPVSLKQNIKPILQQRNYNIPPIIDNIKPQPTAKYIWPSRGDMVGSSKINNTKHAETNRISPSLAGFITARQPQNGSDKYVVVVTEGALKGTIAANYMNVKDSNGQSMADKIAGNNGVILAQVPGVAKAFVASVDRVYKEHNVIGTLIAMDADGRDNQAVAKGIDSAYKELAKYSPVKVMSWNPEHKGLDDSMLAVARGDLTYKQMGIHYGTPQQLFPIDKAVAQIPYKLNGQKAFKDPHHDPQWMTQYRQKLADQNSKLDKAQQDSAKLDVNLNLDDLNDDNENQMSH